MRGTISAQQIAIYLALRAAHRRWLTAREITELTGDVDGRTVRLYLKRWRELGLVEWLEESFPGHLYRLRRSPDPAAMEFAEKLQRLAGARASDRVREEAR